MMEKDHLVTHPSALDKAYSPTFNEAARGQQPPQQQEGSQQVEKDKPYPAPRPGDKDIQKIVDRQKHGQQMADDDARALEKNAGEGKQQEADDRKPLHRIFWKANRRTQAKTAFERAAGSPEQKRSTSYVFNRTARKKDRGIERG